LKNYNGKIVGVLGTVIIHLIAAIIFMSYKLQSLKTRENQIEKFEIEFAAIEEKKIFENRVELPPTSVENVLYDDVEMLNIARNLSSKSEVKIDPEDYIDKVKEELIRSGELGSDNFIDAQRGQGQGQGQVQGQGQGQGQDYFLSSDDDQVSFGKEESVENHEEEVSDSEKMAANFQGPTRIYYDLQGRNHTHLPIPIYKCQGSGKIILTIEVNQRGYVENASVVEKGTASNDECLEETAVSAALVSRFEINLNAPKIQKGTLTYIFVAQ
jgi:hypothetical protein